MNEITETQKLTGVPETLLVALYLRSAETQKAGGIIKDEKAVEMIQNIEYDFARFNKAWASQVGVAVRTEILDEATTAFIRQYPDATVVNMGAGLCTRFNRVDNGRIIWYELDLPEAIEMRRRFFKQNDRYQFIEKSITDFESKSRVRKTSRFSLSAKGFSCILKSKRLKTSGEQKLKLENRHIHLMVLVCLCILTPPRM